MRERDDIAIDDPWDYEEEQEETELSYCLVCHYPMKNSNVSPPSMGRMCLFCLERNFRIDDLPREIILAFNGEEPGEKVSALEIIEACAKVGKDSAQWWLFVMGTLFDYTRNV